MLRYAKGLDRWTRIGLVIMIIWILGFSLFIGIQLQNRVVRATGGDFISTAQVATNAGSTTCVMTFTATATNPAFPFHNDFMIVTVGISGIATTISSIVDTATDTFTKVVSKAVNNNVTLFVAQYSGTSGTTNTITVTFSGSILNRCAAIMVSGLISQTADQTSTGSGSGSAALLVNSVASFTPTNHDFCQSAWFDQSTAGVVTAISEVVAIPQIQSGFGGIQGGVATNDFFHNAYRGDWTSGATTMQINVTITGSTANKFDMIGACFPTAATVTSTTTSTTTTSTTTATTTTTTNGMSAGIVQEKNSSVVTGTTNSLTLDYNPQQYNLLLLIDYSNSGTASYNLPTDNNALVWKSLGSSQSSGSGSIKFYGVNFSIASTTETITATLGSSRTYQFRVFELTGISTNWNTTFQILSNNGVTSSASLPSFTPPKNWFVSENLVYSIGDSSAHTWTTTPFSEFNINLLTMQNNMKTVNNDWTLSAFYPMWNLGATTATITPNSFTSSAWQECVIELPTQTTGIVTNTLTSTTTTTSTTDTTTATTTTTTTPTTTTTTTTTGTTVSTTSTNTSFVTSTGTVFPEPAGSLDLWVVTIGLAAQLIFLIVPVLKRSIWFLTFISGIIGLALAQQLALSPTIAYGATFFTAPQYLYVVVALVAVMSFAFLVWEAINRR